jgi:beta-amylase
VSCRLNSSKPSDAGGSVSPDNGGSENLQDELYHDFSSPQLQRLGSPVFVKLPVDTVGFAGEVRRLKTMTHSLRTLSVAGVEGVVVDVWWGLVERDKPGVYNWQGYLDLFALAKRCGLKVRAVMAFHQCATGPDDRNWSVQISLFF